MGALDTRANAPQLIKGSCEAHRSERSQFVLLLILAALQFVHVLDFVILMPLGPQIMRDLKIGTGQFGVLVSSYHIAAALAGLLGAFTLDRYDRRTALLGAFAGLTCATVACATTSQATTLLLARFAAGLFGGWIQALIFAVVGDCFSDEKRGWATGVVMSAFSVATVLGVPFGLFISDTWDWRSVFIALGIISTAILIAGLLRLPRLSDHLSRKASRESWNLKPLIARRNSLAAFGLIVSLMFAGFTIIPFVSAYLVANLGLDEKDLASVFFAGGVATFATARMTGRIADRLGKTRVFTWIAGLSTIPILVLTHLQSTSVLAIIIVTTFFTTFIAARGIPALALITASIERARRARFLSLTSSIQQISSGAATIVAGWILGQNVDGEITHFSYAGYLAVAFTLLAILFARKLNVDQVDTRQPDLASSKLA